MLLLVAWFGLFTKALFLFLSLQWKPTSHWGTSRCHKFVQSWNTLFFKWKEKKLSDYPSILYYTFLLSLVWGNKDRINLLISIILLTIQSFQTRYQDPPVSWYERCCGQSILKLSNQFNLSKGIWCLLTNILTKKLRLDLVFSLLCEPGWKN